MSLHIVRFDCHRQSSVAYGCNQPGDNSGSYVQAADAMDVIEKLTEALGDMVSDRECLSDATVEFAKRALAKGLEARGEIK